MPPISLALQDALNQFHLSEVTRGPCKRIVHKTLIVPVKHRNKNPKRHRDIFYTHKVAEMSISTASDEADFQLSDSESFISR